MSIRRAAIAFSAMLFLVLAGTGTGHALWSAQARTSGSVSAGAVGIAQSGFSGLATVYQPSELATTAPVTVTNTGSIAAPFRLAIAPASANDLARAVLVTTWPVETSSACSPTSDVPTGTIAADSTAVPVLKGTLAPGGSTVQCIRTSLTNEQAAAYPGASVSLTLALSSAVGTWTSSVDAVVAQSVIDTVAPSAPGTPVASRTSGYSATLAWAPSSDIGGVTAYDVYRGGQPIATATEPTYTDVSLTAGNVYQYSIRARDAAGNVSAASGATTVTALPVASTTWYKIININSELCIDASGVSGDDGTQLITYECHNGPNQSWQFASVGDGYYKVVPQHAQSAAWDIGTLYENGNAAGARVQLWQFNGASDQQFEIRRLRDGVYSFVSRRSEECVDVTNASAVAGTPLQQFACNTTPAQSFRLSSDFTAPSAPGAPAASDTSGYSTTLSWSPPSDDVGVTGYEIYRDSQRIATVTSTLYTDAGLSAGASYTYTIRARDGGNNVSAVSGATTVTTLPVTPSAWYSVVNPISAMCVDAQNAATTNGTPLVINPCTGAAHQSWQFQPASDGYYLVVARHAVNRAWDITSNSQSRGARIQLYDTYGGANQQWRINPIGDGAYEIRSRHSGLCLEVVDQGTAAGTALQQNSCAGNPAQRFALNLTG